MRRLLNEVELVNTRRKLARLEQRYAAHERETGGDDELREMTLESLQRLINQLKEEILWTEAVSARSPANPASNSLSEHAESGA